MCFSASCGHKVVVGFSLPASDGSHASEQSMQVDGTKMTPQDKRYYSGESVHAGDIVRFAGVPTVVVFCE